jgi:hypothetical protein
LSALFLWLTTATAATIAPIATMATTTTQTMLALGGIDSDGVKAYFNLCSVNGVEKNAHIT